MYSNPTNSWISDNTLKCVILCAGEGKRIKPYSNETPKPLIHIKGKPILYYIINYWKQHTNDFIFVVGYKKNQIIKYITNNFSINAQFIEQQEQKGIADALTYIKEFINDKFIVVLGDCLCKGDFIYPKIMANGIGVWETTNIQDIKQNYSVKINNSLVKRVIEKPNTCINNYCGMGYYFLTKKVFKYIEKTKPSSLRNEIEITDVLQTMIDSNEDISPIFFKGEYLNVTYPYDMTKGEHIV